MHLLDEFLAQIPPEDIPAIVMPTLEEVRQTMDAQGADWVDRTLAAAGVPRK